ncbi:MAG: 2-oxoisovalerate dehydrogenase [Acidobacteria bacterium]|nr:MAG: 2-oxoisovalerate dehydrogenase [Acidobacteriota bacterium]
MDEIAFEVSRDEESGWLIAHWDAPDRSGGITTQGEDLRDLQAQIVDAVATHFEENEAPRRIRLHFINDPILVSI